MAPEKVNKVKEQSVTEQTTTVKTKSAFREYAEAIIMALILALFIRTFIVQAFKIPSGSMEETLQIGDHILVNKFLYRFSRPKLSDVIVFKYPWEENRDFIKRIVGLPGDQVEIQNQQVFVNGRLLEEPYIAPDARRLRPYHFGPLRVPKKGDEVEIRADRRLYLNGEAHRTRAATLARFQTLVRDRSLSLPIVDEDLATLLYDWHRAGYVTVQSYR